MHDVSASRMWLPFITDTDLVGLNHGAPSAIQSGVAVGADEARVVLGVLVAVVLADVDDTINSDDDGWLLEDASIVNLTVSESAIH